MTKTPRWHERIRVFNNYYNAFNDSYSKYENDESLLKTVFDYLKISFEFYHKSLKDILCDFGIYMYLPKEILLQAHLLKIINDSNVWLDYIEELNNFYQTYGNDEQNALMISIINKYKSKLESPYKSLNYYYDSHPYNIEYEHKPLDTSSVPRYDSSDIGIFDASYDILLNYLKNNKNIKYVWLHGSRAKGNAKLSSDIDLLIDIDNSLVEQCKKDFYNLPIPYRVDFACINDDSFNSANDSTLQVFLSKVVDDAKIIYRYDDFNKI